MNTKILDCTIRDGGYLNDWQFNKELVKDLYRAVSKSGVDFVEIGFRSSSKYFNASEMGQWRFTPEDIVNEIAGEISGAPISIMVDYGKVDLSDIVEAQRSRVSLYRVAVHKDKVFDAIRLCNEIVDKGYTVAIQLMGIVGYTEDDFSRLIGPLQDSKISIVYIADSYGSLLPSDIAKYLTILRQTGKAIGFHAHNNLQLAFANTLAAINAGIDIVDGTVYGMGRGAGNLPLEALITYFEKTLGGTRYNVLPILELIDKYFINLQKEFPWGYNLPYMISGVYEVHPNYATYLMESSGYTIEDIQLVLELIYKMNPVGFDRNIIPQILQTGFIGQQRLEGEQLSETNGQNINQLKETVEVPYLNRHESRDFLILANGPSLVSFREKIQELIEAFDPIIIGSNYLGGLFVPHYHSFNNMKRFADHVKDVHPKSNLLLSNAFPIDFIQKHTNREYELIQHSNDTGLAFNIKNGVIMNNCRAVSVLSIATAIVMGARRLFVAGMDGYKDFETFIDKGIHANVNQAQQSANAIMISARSGDYKAQMDWHNTIESLLRQINEYLVSHNLDELMIITPTTHRPFYRDIDSFLNWRK